MFEKFRYLRKDEETKKREETNKVSWVKDCEICDAVLSKWMDELVAPISNGGMGLSECKAAQ